MKNNLRFSEVIFLLLLVLIIRLCFAYFANWLIWMVGWLEVNDFCAGKRQFEFDYFGFLRCLVDYLAKLSIWGKVNYDKCIFSQVKR